MDHAPRHKNDPSAKAAAEMRRLLAEQASPFAADGRSILAGQKAYTPEEVVSVLRPYLTDARADKVEQVLDGRTTAVVPVVDGVVDTGNVSAVMRSAEGFGYQCFHVVVGDAVFKRSDRITGGADKWLDVRTWHTPQACASHLTEQGYRIVVAHLDAAVPVSEVDFTRKTALVFGNEKEGVSPEMLALADQRCLIPMSGFVQSFNISVAAAVCLYHAYRDRLVRQGHHGDLDETDRERYRALYYLRSVRSADKILARTRSSK